jgi:hypothetical protein
MFDKVKEIAESWIIANNPSESQLQLAEERLKICKGCDKMVKGTLVELKCSECGCPINKKIFSPKFDACPLHKWLDVESSDVFVNTRKQQNSLI